MRINFRNIIFTALIVLNCLAIYVFLRPKSSPSNKKISFNFLKLEAWDSYLNFVTKNENTIIDTNIILRSEGNVSAPISKTIGADKTLVIMYTSSDCELCVSAIMDVVKEKLIARHIKMIAITEGYSPKSFTIVAKNNSYDVPLYLKESGDFNFSVEHKDKPFFFVLDKNGRAHKFFVPIKEFPQKTSEYLDLIEIYLKNDTR